MDIEHMLGTLLRETLVPGGKGKKGKKKKKKKGKNRGDSLVEDLSSKLLSGKGLVTAIGLGVGAYEIYRSTQRQQPPPSGGVSGGAGHAGTVPAGSAPVPGGVAPPAGSAPPPPPPPPGPAPRAVPAASVSQASAAAKGVTGSGDGAPAAPAAAGSPPAGTAPAPGPLRTGGLDEEALARRIIQVMVAAAHADGSLDADEEQAILDQLRDIDLDQEEKLYLAAELHRPREIAELAAGIEDPRMAQTLYAVAVSTVVVDTDAERAWLDELGRALGLSAEMTAFIEETV